jgi:acyl-coenzyme A synthetase/AMP-(fatty) acid ligase
MNLENNNDPILGFTHSEVANVAIFPASSDEAGPARCGSTSSGLSRSLFAIAGLGLCMGLSSCVVPYDTYGQSDVTVTTYRPGYQVTALPRGYRSEVISGTTYYYYDGHYYRRGSGGYVVVEAPRTSRYYADYGRYQQGRHQVITRLPGGYREVTYRGQRYYQVGDRYYRRQGDGYIIVSRPY